MYMYSMRQKKLRINGPFNGRPFRKNRERTDTERMLNGCQTASERGLPALCPFRLFQTVQCPYAYTGYFSLWGMQEADGNSTGGKTEDVKTNVSRS